MSTLFILNAITKNGAQVTASTAVPATGNKYRLRTLTVCAAGDGTNATGPIQFVVRDGPTGAGSIIWEGICSAPAIGANQISQDGMDIRTTNQLTIESTAGGGNSTQLSVHASGDIVLVGYPGYAVPQGT